MVEFAIVLPLLLLITGAFVELVLVSLPDFWDYAPAAAEGAETAAQRPLQLVNLGAQAKCVADSPPISPSCNDIVNPGGELDYPWPNEAGIDAVAKYVTCKYLEASDRVNLDHIDVNVSIEDVNHAGAGINAKLVRVRVNRNTPLSCVFCFQNIGMLPQAQREAVFLINGNCT